MKLKLLRSFLEEGHMVRLVVLFRGREVIHPEIGEKLIQDFILDCWHLISKPNTPRLDGKRMDVVLNPRKHG